MHFDFRENYILEDAFVRLSPLTEQQIPMLRNLALEPEIWTYFIEKGQGEKQYESYIYNALRQHKLGAEYPFVVFDKVTKRCAGMTRFYEYSGPFQTIKLGHTWYGKDFRGSWINKHCKFLLFEFAFEKLGIERIGFGVYAHNRISLAALKSVGCQQEGTLRNFFPAFDGAGRVDCVLFSILKEDWLKTEKAKLTEKLHGIHENFARSR